MQNIVNTFTISSPGLVLSLCLLVKGKCNIRYHQLLIILTIRIDIIYLDLSLGCSNIVILYKQEVFGSTNINQSESRNEIQNYKALM